MRPDATLSNMRRVFVAVFLGFCLAFPSTPEAGLGRFGGTFIGVIVTREGILLGSDSRSTFLDESGRSVGYVDRIPKIYVGSGAAIAVAGLTSVDEELFSSFVRRNQNLLDLPANEILYDVIQRLPIRNTTSVLLFSAGFVGGKPTICAKAPFEDQTCHGSGFLANKNSAGLRRWLEGQNGRAVTAADSAKALKTAILEAGDLDSAVGGPISILLVSSNAAPRWLENPPDDHGWRRICDLVTSYRRGSTMIFFTDTKQVLDSYLDSVCPR